LSCVLTYLFNYLVVSDDDAGDDNNLSLCTAIRHGRIAETRKRDGRRRRWCL